MPYHSIFAPENASPAPVVKMAVDEFETIRLMDLEGYTQEQCASQMGIARTTVQGIYDTARNKLALALVKGRRLVIDGGEYRLCEQFEPDTQQKCTHCGRCRCGQKPEREG